MQLQLNAGRRLRPDTEAKYWKAKALIKDEGRSVINACRTVKMSTPTYQNFKKNFDPDPFPSVGLKRGPKVGSKNKQTYLDIPMASETVVDDKMVVVVCKASQLKNILDGLK